MQDLEKLVAEATALFAGIDDADALEQSIAPFRGAAGLAWQRAEPTLEDAFIRMMADAEQRL